MDKGLLLDALMLIEIAFMDGGEEAWKKDPLLIDYTKDDIACLAHSLVQCFVTGSQMFAAEAIALCDVMRQRSQSI